MNIRVATGAIAAAAATGLAGAASGVATNALLLMATGLALTAIGIGFALASVKRRTPKLRPPAPTIEPGLTRPGARSGGTSSKRTLPATSHVASRPAEAHSLRAEPRDLTPREVLHALTQSCAAAGTVLAASIWLLDDATKATRFVAGTDEQLVPELGHGASLAPITEAACTGYSLLRRMPIGSVVGSDHFLRFVLPLSADGIKGAVAIDMADGEPDRETLIQCTARLRSSLTAALVARVARTEAAETAMLQSASRDIFRLTDAGEIPVTALETALAISRGERGSIALREDDGTLSIRASISTMENVGGSPTAQHLDEALSLVIDSNRAAMVSDLDIGLERHHPTGIRSTIVAPVADGDEVLGVLIVENDMSGAWRSTHRMRTLEGIGAITATALKNAQARSHASTACADSVKVLALCMETDVGIARGHTQRVYAVAMKLGAQLGMTDDELRALGFAALLHDIGMAAAGNLDAMGDRPLTTVERGLVRAHPAAAAGVLENDPMLRATGHIVMHHHERYDGEGYPHGVSGDDIPQGARVLAVADAYVSMTSPRTYRPSMTVDAAFAELESLAGTQFDPTVVRALSELVSTASLD